MVWEGQRKTAAWHKPGHMGIVRCSQVTYAKWSPITMPKAGEVGTTSRTSFGAELMCSGFMLRGTKGFLVGRIA